MSFIFSYSIISLAVTWPPLFSKTTFLKTLSFSSTPALFSPRPTSPLYLSTDVEDSLCLPLALLSLGSGVCVFALWQSPDKTLWKLLNVLVLMTCGSFLQTPDFIGPLIYSICFCHVGLMPTFVHQWFPYHSTSCQRQRVCPLHRRHWFKPFEDLNQSSGWRSRNIISLPMCWWEASVSRFIFWGKHRARAHT